MAQSIREKNPIYCGRCHRITESKDSNCTECGYSKINELKEAANRPAYCAYCRHVTGTRRWVCVECELLKPLRTKGGYGGECARRACKGTNATYYNQSTDAFYCEDCAIKLNNMHKGDLGQGATFGLELCLPDRECDTLRCAQRLPATTKQKCCDVCLEEEKKWA